MQDRVTQVQIVNRMIEAGESEEDIAAVIRQFKSEPAEPLKKDSFLTALGRTIVPTPFGAQIPLKRVMQAAPAAGAGAAVAMSGGTAAVPLMALAGAGGAAGQAASDAVSGEELSGRDRLVNMGEAGLSQALQQRVGGIVASGASKLAQGAKNYWGRLAKVSKPVARNTQTMRAGGTLDQGKDEIAETVLSQGAGTIKPGSVEAMRGKLSDLDDEIDSIIASSKGLVSRQELRNAIQAKASSIPQGSQAAEVQLAALEKSFLLLNKLPPKMTVAKAQELKRSIYQAYEKTFAADTTQQATAMAEKTTARALRSGVAREEPSVAPINEQMSKLIPATKAVEEAVSRTSNHDPVRLTTVLAGLVTQPKTVTIALINHPKVGSFTAQQLYNAAAKLPKDARTAGNIIRMAGVLMSAGRNEDE